ncbi:MAG: rRNA maturation RNase YbeY [Kiritimatiellia bacterium]
MQLRIVRASSKRTPLPLDKPDIRRAAAYFAMRSQRRMHANPAWESLTLVLMDDRSIAEANAAIMGHEGPTDVITQRYDSLPGEPPGLVGELYINLDETSRHANPPHEFLLYLAHGCDHLSGADDSTPPDRVKMRRRELGWIRDFLS